MINNINPVILIAGITKNRAIGKNGDLVVKSKTDLKHFKDETSGHVVIMGWNTYKSLPKFPLPNRKNIVVCPQKYYEDKETNVSYMPDVYSALSVCDEEEHMYKKRFIIGGGMLYKTTIDMADYLYITEFDTVVEDADTYFPEINMNEWEVIEEVVPEYLLVGEVPCKFIKYRRIVEHVEDI